MVNPEKDRSRTRHPAVAPGRVAVITGGASGIGLAVAERLGAAGPVSLPMEGDPA